MAYGSPSASSSIELNYAPIVRALEEKKSKGRGYTDKVIVHAPNVYVHRNKGGDNVYLHLHNTDIVEFRPDGTKALFAGGWHLNQLTRHWWWQAVPGLHFSNAAPNQYSDKQLFTSTGHYGGSWSLYYDGMVVDASGHRISEVKYGVKRLPNAEAKALRKKWLEVMKREYMPHVDMFAASNTPLFPYNQVQPAHTIEMLKKGEFDYEVMRTAMVIASSSERASMERYVRNIWVHYIKIYNLLDEAPYLPK